MTELLERNPAARRAADGELVLDEIDRFIDRYVSCKDEQRWAMILYAAATHVIQECATFPRMLFASGEPESGKTLAMEVTAALCSRPIDAAGTPFDLVAALAEASLEPEKPVPTVKRDEIVEVFPNGGNGNSSNVVADILRRGYKCGTTRGRARGGTSQRYSIFTPFLMTGLRTSVPVDIRGRCIVVTMVRGTPKEYFDARDAEQDAYSYGRVLARAARMQASQVREFRVLKLGIPRLTGRKAEVWEPLFAVALAIGGQKWLNRCVSAFRSLALAEMDAPELTPGQKLLQAVVEIAPGLALAGFVPGNTLGDEMRRLPQYEGRSLASMNKLLSDTLPVNTQQRRMPSGDRMRGYQLVDLFAAWERMRPMELEDMEEQEEENPFDLIDEEDDESEDIDDTSGTTGTGGFTPVPVTQPVASESVL